MSFDRTYKRNKQRNRDYNFIDDFKWKVFSSVFNMDHMVTLLWGGFSIFLRNIFLSANSINLFLGDIHRD